MKSAVSSAAFAAMVLSGGAAAQSGFYGNSTGLSGTGATSYPTGGSTTPAGTAITLSGTGSSTTSSSTAAPTASDPVFCPALAGKDYAAAGGVTYKINCDTNYGGTLINLGTTKRSSMLKRQYPGTSLDDCLNTCSAITSCVATAYNTNDPTCYYYSSLGSAFQANGYEFGTVVSRSNSTTSASSTGTGTYPSGTGITSGTGVTSVAPYPTGNNTSVAPIGSGTGTVGSSSSTSLSSSSTETSSSSTETSSSSTETSSSSTETSSSSTGISSSLTSSSSTGTSTTSSATSSSTSLPENFFCPSLNGQLYIDGLNIQYLIECNTNHFGITIDISISKRQASAATGLGDCLIECDQITGCVGTAYDSNAATCTFYSEIGAAYTEEGVDFAIVVPNSVVATPGETLTSTVFSTGVQTVSSCAPTVTDCPYASGAVAIVTEVIPVSETVYICPTLTTFPAAPVACTACPYAAITGTVYSTAVETIYSCAPTVTNCPYAGGATTVGAGAVGGAGQTVYVTDVVTSTVTTCPAGQTVTVSGSTTVLPTATVITTTYTTQATVTSTIPGVVAITTTVATAVGTSVVNYPYPSGTGAVTYGAVGTTVTYGTGATTVTYGAAGTTVTYGAAGTTVVSVSGVAATTIAYSAPVATVSAGAAGTTSVVAGAAGTTVVTAGGASASVATVIPVAASSGSIVTQISDGQIQAPATGVATGAASGTATSSPLASYTGMANRVTVGAGALVAGIAFLL